ncbi:hypothetical protein GCM10027074_71730 [Streptomyces deserti]
MAAHTALVSVAAVVCMTATATRTPLWAVIGLAGVGAVLTGTVLDHFDALGVSPLDTDRPPIVETPLAHAADLEAVAAFRWEEGIRMTLVPCPLVPRDRVGFRVQVTALDSDDDIDIDIDRLTGVLSRLFERFALRPMA